MKIGIDISQIVYGTGVSRYTQNLVETLLKIDKSNEYVLFFSSLRQKLTPDFRLQTPGSKLQTFKFPPALLDIIWNKFHVLPIEKLIGKVDVFHTSDWTEPPARAAKVTTIHDLTPLLYPKETHPKIVAVHKRKLEWVKKESKLIIAVSEATKKDIIKNLGIKEGRIRVIHEAADEEFGVGSSELGVSKTKRKYGIEGDYLLAFGGPSRKNIKTLVKTFSRLPTRDSQLNLVIIGSPSNTTYSIFAKRNQALLIPHTTYLSYVPQEDLPALYSGASCLVYASLYEGFGLPILEAMSCGCPVVTSNISSMPEVAGEAAVLVDPLSVKSITKGVEEAIKNREKLIKKGFEQVKKFSWEKCARETLAVYEEVVS